MPTPAAPDTAASTCFNLLGPLTVTVGGTAVPLGGRRQVAVLARLLLSPGQVVSIEQLSDSVWDGDAPARPEVTLRSYLSNLRRCIEPDRRPGDRHSRIESVAPGYRILVEPVAIDVIRFEELVHRGRHALAGGDPGSAVALLDQAGALWRGEPCEGVFESDAIRAFRSRLEELRLVAIEVSIEARLGLGQHETVLADLEPVLADHPLRERLTGLAMLALYRAGRQSEALAVCQALRHRLVERLGVDPGPPIQELERKILSHDPTLADLAPVAATPAAATPAATIPAAGTPVAATPVEAATAVAPAAERTEPAGPAPIEVGPEGLAPVGSVPVDVGLGLTAPTGTVGPAGWSGTGDSLVVGRARELAVLAGAVQALLQGRGATLLLSGEPGSGKTTLVSRLAEQVTAAGGTAGWGRCRSVAADRVLWPWSQILDHLAAAVNPADLPSLADLAGLAPSLDPGRHAQPGPGPTGPRTPSEAAGLFPAITELLRRLSARTPLLIVLDDAHWADEASVELAAFAATALADHPVTIAVTWSDTEPAAGAGARPALRQLAGLAAATRVVLGGLEPVAVLELLEPVGAGWWDGPRELLARALTRATAGNPFLIKELIAARAEAPPGSAPAGPGRTDGTLAGDEAVVGQLVVELCELSVSTRVRDVMLNRVDRTHPEARAALSAAALVRGPFGADLVAEATGLDPAVAETVLDAATRAGLLAEDGPTRQSYRFVHPVTAQALSAELPGPRTGRLHASLGQGLWRQGAEPAQLAYHFSRAGTPGASLLAARFALASVHHAGRLDSLLEAEGVIVQGLEAVPHPDDTDGLGLDLALFSANMAQLRGDRSGFEAAAERALGVARTTDDAAHAEAWAALALTGPQPDGPHLAALAWVADDLDREWAAAVAVEALDRAGPGRWTALLERRLARLRGEALPPARPDRPDRPGQGPPGHHDLRSSDRSPGTAIRLSGPGAIRAPGRGAPGSVDDTRPSSWDPDRDHGPRPETGGAAGPGSAPPIGAADPWLALAAWREGALLALEAGPGAWAEPELPAPVPKLAPVIHDQLLALRLRLLGGGSPGDPVAAAADQGPARAAGPDPVPTGHGLRWGRRGHPPDLAEIDLALTGVTIDLLAGRLNHAAAHLAPILTWCDHLGLAPDAVGQLAALIAWEQGRSDDLAAVARQRLGPFGGPAATAWRAAAAAGAGDKAGAGALLDACPTLRIADPLAPVADHCLLALAAHACGHRAAAQAVLPRLLTRRTGLASRGAGLVVLGPVAWYAALAALTLGRVELTGELLTEADRAGRAVGAPQWRVRLLAARAEWAELAGDLPAALAARDEAREAAGPGQGWLDGWLARPGLQSVPNRFATR